jgi:hypothetical protein
VTGNQPTINQTEGSMAGTANTSSDSKAAPRFVVALPVEVGKAIDKLIQDEAAYMRKHRGIGIEISRSQMVSTLVNDALHKREQVTEAA